MAATNFATPKSTNVYQLKVDSIELVWRTLEDMKLDEFSVEDVVIDNGDNGCELNNELFTREWRKMVCNISKLDTKVTDGSPR